MRESRAKQRAGCLRLDRGGVRDESAVAITPAVAGTAVVAGSGDRVTSSAVTAAAARIIAVDAGHDDLLDGMQHAGDSIEYAAAMMTRLRVDEAATVVAGITAIRRVIQPFAKVDSAAS